MKKQTFVFLLLLLCGVVIAVLLPGLILQVQEGRIVGTRQYAPSERYSFRSDEQGLSLFGRLEAAADMENSHVSLEFDSVSNVYGSRKTMLEQLNAELHRYLSILMPSMPSEDRPQLPEDTYLHYEYILERNTMQGFMYCQAECSVAGGEIYVIMDMESRRIVQLELYNTGHFPTLYDYFSLRLSDQLAAYYGVKLEGTDFTANCLNMLLEGGGQAGSIRLTDEKECAFSIAFSCWQDGLLFYPKSE